MKYPCETIRDLIPLYHDSVCSAETVRIVEEHLEECPACAEYYESICASDKMETGVFDETSANRIADSYREVKKKRRRRILTVVGIFAGSVAAILIAKIILLFLAAALILTDAALSKVEVHTDVSEYSLYRSGPDAKKEYDYRWISEDIWPETITDDMNVVDYKMVYYNPWDAQYLGYLVVEYDDDAYQKELFRLNCIGIDDYEGIYSVTGFTKYELVAMNSDEYHGFVYAITDGDGTIIYAEELFCNYFMDLKYEKYIPKEYLPDGFDAREGNQYMRSH